MSALDSARISLARTVGRLSRLRGRGGTSAPGRVMLRISPHAIRDLATRLTDGSAVISATNGKTTTAAMAAEILRAAGHRPVHNSAGANMAGGIATTLVQSAGRGSQIDGDIGLFEVDEAWLEQLVAELHPRVIALGNLFRDQLDRYGELEKLADAWTRAGEQTAAQLVLNADDPLVAYLGAGRPRALYFGVADDSVSYENLGHAVDAGHCRRCGARLEFDRVYLGHLGRYHCPVCGLTRPQPTIAATEIELHGVRDAEFTLMLEGRAQRVKLALPGLYNVYNALCAAAAAHALGAGDSQIAAGLEATKPAFGRAEAVRLGPTGREMQILLIKNPVGATEVLRTLALEGSGLTLLAVLNDRIADGRDVSWIWDADFELLAGQIASVTCAGTRAADMATRLQYAGVDPARVRVEPDLASALELAATDGTGTLYAVPTYTAMLELRGLLEQRGEIERAWA